MQSLKLMGGYLSCCSAGEQLPTLEQESSSSQIPDELTCEVSHLL